MQQRTRVAVLVSGAGTTMQALVEATRMATYPAEIVVVIADRDCPAIKVAGKLGILVDILDYRALGREVFERELDMLLLAFGVELVCLAGFMRILGPEIVTRWRMLNTHPSLLPEFKGLRVQERVLAAGRTVAGCTVHHVVPELDAGPTVLQMVVPVRRDDTPATLEERVKAAERMLYPAALQVVIQQQAARRVH